MNKEEIDKMFDRKFPNYEYPEKEMLAKDYNDRIKIFIHQLLSQNRKDILDEVIREMPEKINKKSALFYKLFSYLDCCGLGEEEGFNVCRTEVINLLNKLRERV